MPSEALCGQLQVFSTALQQAVQIIAAKETEVYMTHVDISTSLHYNPAAGTCGDHARTVPVVPGTLPCRPPQHANQEADD